MVKQTDQAFLVRTLKCILNSLYCLFIIHLFFLNLICFKIFFSFIQEQCEIDTKPVIGQNPVNLEDLDVEDLYTKYKVSNRVLFFYQNCLI